MSIQESFMVYDRINPNRLKQLGMNAGYRAKFHFYFDFVSFFCVLIPPFYNGNVYSISLYLCNS